MTVVFQVNGKLRAKLELPVGTPEEELKAKALDHPRVKEYTDGKTIVKIVTVPNKLVSIVVK